MTARISDHRSCPILTNDGKRRILGVSIGHLTTGADPGMGKK